MSLWNDHLSGGQQCYSWNERVFVPSQSQLGYLIKYSIDSVWVNPHHRLVKRVFDKTFVWIALSVNLELVTIFHEYLLLLAVTLHNIESPAVMLVFYSVSCLVPCFVIYCAQCHILYFSLLIVSAIITCCCLLWSPRKQNNSYIKEQYNTNI